MSSRNSQWTLFKPGTLVLTTFHGYPRVLEVKSYKEQVAKGQCVGVIEGVCVDYDGKRFGYDTVGVINPYYDGVKKIVDLPVYPFSHHPDMKEMKASLVARGHKFASMQGHCCMEYTGPTISSAGH